MFQQDPVPKQLWTTQHQQQKVPWYLVLTKQEKVCCAPQNMTSESAKSKIAEKHRGAKSESVLPIPPTKSESIIPMTTHLYN